MCCLISYIESLKWGYTIGSLVKWERKFEWNRRSRGGEKEGDETVEGKRK